MKGVKRVKTVAVTGGIGSGKTALCSYLAGKWVPVYDSDQAAKRLYDISPDLVAAIRSAFGPDVAPDGKIDRKALAAVVFSDPQGRTQLEELVHPVVKADFIRWREGVMAGLPASWCGYTSTPFVVMESAIILSKPLFDDVYDVSLAVTAPMDVRLERVLRRDGISREGALSRMESQEESFARAAAVLANEGTLKELFGRADALFADWFGRPRS